MWTHYILTGGREGWIEDGGMRNGEFLEGDIKEGGIEGICLSIT
jgi:hypothetical protein